MIICSQHKLEISKIYGPNTIKDSFIFMRGVKISDFKFMVMREATEEEYVKYYKEKYNEKPDKAFYKNFYQVSVD